MTPLADLLEERRRRIERLEDALAEYMHVVDLVSFKVEGDLRHDFLLAWAQAVAALPREKYQFTKPLEREVSTKPLEREVS